MLKLLEKFSVLSCGKLVGVLVAKKRSQQALKH
jgi:hypothetical protein